MTIDAREPLGRVTIAMIGVTAKVPNRVDHVTRETTVRNALGRLLLTIYSVTPTMSSVIVALNTAAWLETLQRILWRVLATCRLTLMPVARIR